LWGSFDSPTSVYYNVVASIARRIRARMAVLHDIGKIGISDAILLKLAALTPDERPDRQRSTSVRAWRHEPSHLTLRV
jgi:hypothetical protein